jgi:translation initiation factor IF-1
MDYLEAKRIYSELNGVERIPSFVMKVIIDYENKNIKKEELGMSLELFKNLPKKHIDKIINNGFQIYSYINNNDYINYENLKNGDLVAVKFNGVNYETIQISKYIKLRSTKNLKDGEGCCINAHPPENFHKRYKIFELTLKTLKT